MNTQEAVENTEIEDAEEHEEVIEQSEGDDFSEEEQQAYKQGWRPKEDWVEDGKPEEGWIDASQFLENGRLDTLRKRAAFLETELKSHKTQTEKRLKEQHEAFQRGLEIQKQELIRQYDAKITTAVEEGDTETYHQLAAEKAEAVGKFDEPEKKADQAETDPAAAEWLERNDWMEIDEGARNLANLVFARHQKANPDASITESLEAAEKRVRKKYPDYFDDDEEQIEPTPKTQNNGRERTMADVKVSPGNRGGTSKKKSAANSLSAFDRQVGEDFVRDGLFKDLDAYAASLQAKNAEREEGRTR